MLVTVAAVLGTASAASAAAGNAQLSNQLVVKYDDLDLSSEHDAKILYKRLTSASMQVCSKYASRELSRRAKWEGCIDQALTKAVVDVNVERVTALHHRTRNEQAS
jgi:UrcA family protein